MATISRAMAGAAVVAVAGEVIVDLGLAGTVLAVTILGGVVFGLVLWKTMLAV